MFKGYHFLGDIPFAFIRHSDGITYYMRCDVRIGKVRLLFSLNHFFEFPQIKVDGIQSFFS